MKLRGAMWVLAVVAILGCVSCSSYDVGPSLPVDVQIQGLRATTGDTARCCCHVTGTVVNQSTVPVHVTIRFGAFRDSEVDPFARILFFVRDMEPNETEFFEASGFVYSCSEIDKVEIDDVDVTGIVFPS